jgi:hypothetical protein
MRIFALETDPKKIEQRFCHGDECVILSTHFHGISFSMAVIREVLLTSILLTVVGLAAVYSWPMVSTLTITGAVFLLFVIPTTIKAYLDWKYDFIIVTTDKVILVDQTSFFHNEVKPILFDNIGGVSARTQWLGMFQFGEVVIALKEGEGGGDILRRYVPNAREVAAVISEAATTYQRRQYGHEAMKKAVKNLAEQVPNTEPVLSEEIEVESSL